MDSLFREMERRKARLMQTIEFCRKCIEGVPAGHLRVDQSKKAPHFYLINDEPPGVHYLRKEDGDLASRIAQKEYCEKTLSLAQAEIREIDAFCCRFRDNRADLTYSSLIPARQDLVKPAILDDTAFAQRWLAQDFESCPLYPEAKLFMTRQGQMVRSKTELMQANVYDELGIPYRYEAKLVLHDGTVWYPDFTTLHVGKRMVVYHEHLGLLDDMEYRRQAMIKIDAYKRNGIFIGKNLILTSETKGCPFNLETFRSTIRELFWCEDNGRPSLF